jgi:hypothetical protein
MVSFYPYLMDTSIRTHRLRVCFGGAEQHRNHGVSNLTHGEQIGKCAGSYINLGVLTRYDSAFYCFPRSSLCRARSRFLNFEPLQPVTVNFSMVKVLAPLRRQLRP